MATRQRNLCSAASGPPCFVRSHRRDARSCSPPLDSSGSLIASNDNWRSARLKSFKKLAWLHPMTAKLPSSPLSPPASYTAVVSDAANSPGVALFEFYDLDPASSQLINLSTRGRRRNARERNNRRFYHLRRSVDSIRRPRRRPVPRSIGNQRCILDPTLELSNATDDDFPKRQLAIGSGARGILDSTLAPSDDRESAVSANLTPGPYSAIGWRGRTRFHWCLPPGNLSTRSVVGHSWTKKTRLHSMKSRSRVARIRKR